MDGVEWVSIRLCLFESMSCIFWQLYNGLYYNHNQTIRTSKIGIGRSLTI